jgi:putative transposase
VIRRGSLAAQRILAQESACRQRWIGFSEDDGRPDRRRRKSRAARCILFANALRTTRSTNICSEIAGSLVKLAGMKIYRGFPERLHHRVPPWVEPGALFHVRIALDREKEQKALTSPGLAQQILDSARFYERRLRWHITLFLLMPDHLHAMLSFARNQSMSEVIRDWKRFHTRTNDVLWQEGYFDHRLRADERGEQISTKMNYIRQNPVAAGLCATTQEWPWVMDPFAP